jgi:hypothetical protein
MRQFLTIAALVAASLVTINSAEAGKPGPGSGKSSNVKSYHQTHDTKYSHDTTYRHDKIYSGKDHHHWTCHYYWDKYGCESYYCPYTYCWYYWYEPKCCYYPVSHITVQPPEVVSTTTVVTQVASGGQGLPTTGPDGKPYKP